MSKRSDTFERKFSREKQLRFEAETHCDRLLGFWAADRLGKQGADAAAYVAEIIGCDIEEGGREAVLRRIAKDLDRSGITEQQVRDKLRQCLDKSNTEIRTTRELEP